MFTGIIESTGKIINVKEKGSNKVFQVSNPFANELKVDQSVSHDGVCLTIEAISGDQCQVTAITETLSKTNLNDWAPGFTINLERCMVMNSRIDGHIVQGHVDTTAKCLKRIDRNGSWEFTFEVGKQFAPLMIEKGSISLNGISLTIFNVSETTFSVGIIPYTYNNTNMRYVEPGDRVNIEFDMLGKYVNRMAAIKNNA